MGRDSQIVDVVKVGEGVLIVFRDESCAFYSDSLLLAVRPQAVEIVDADDPDEGSDAN